MNQCKSFFVIFLQLTLCHSTLDAKGPQGPITGITYTIRDELRRITDDINDQRFDDARDALERLEQTYGNSREFAMYRGRFITLNNQLETAQQESRASERIVFDKIVISRRDPGRYPDYANKELYFSKPIYIDPTIPLEDALNRWLRENRDELLKTVAVRPQDELFVVSVLFVDRYDDRYLSSRRNPRLLHTPARDLNLRSTYSRLSVTIR